jgi:hypothetical protein
MAHSALLGARSRNQSQENNSRAVMTQLSDESYKFIAAIVDY